MNAMNRSLALAWLVLLVLPTPMAARAQSAEEFYRGKQLTFIASYAVGIDYDTWTRHIARYLPRYIPGHPSVIVQNMVGAGGLQAANYLANIAPRDGTYIMIDWTQSALPGADQASKRPL